ncbi:MAG TPA: MarR family transcriptional regulator [Solirubrobacteraceae bacterium]|nr:MarR family transcriptional regulator [Solirubrobacteraceae bacterium]
MQATTTDAAAGADAQDKALAADLYALVSHLHKNCNADLFEAVGELELSLTQIKLLHHLAEATHELTLKQGAELVHVSLPAASRMVDDLVRRGFVARHEDLDDRRMKRVSITPQGQAVIARLNAARLNGLEQFVAGLGPGERRALSQALVELLARPEVASLRLEAS